MQNFHVLAEIQLAPHLRKLPLLLLSNGSQISAELRPEHKVKKINRCIGSQGDRNRLEIQRWGGLFIP